MDERIEILKNLKSDFKNIEIGDAETISTLLAKIRMYITSFFPYSYVHYLDNWNSIKFNCFRTKNLKTLSAFEQEKSWNLSKEQVYLLLDIMIGDIALSNRSTSQTNKPPIQVINMNKSTKVFIVHGHDDSAKIEVARFVERAGLEAVILHERPNLGATIIEKIERETDVGFGIILYTPCDVGNSQEKSNELNARARQNVVFEHGYLVAKLGRKKVVALVKGSVEKPSDIDGIVYEPMDSGGAWKYRIANEMNEVGFEFDLNKI